MLKGPLMKYTNLVTQWQIRYCVLDEERSLFFYYYSDPNHSKSSQSECESLMSELGGIKDVQISGGSTLSTSSNNNNNNKEPRKYLSLINAFVGIESESSLNFSIASQKEQIHLRALSIKDRDVWVRQIDSVIRQARMKHSKLCLTGDVSKRVVEQHRQELQRQHSQKYEIVLETDNYIKYLMFLIEKHQNSLKKSDEKLLAQLNSFLLVSNSLVGINNLQAKIGSSAFNSAYDTTKSSLKLPKSISFVNQKTSHKSATQATFKYYNQIPEWKPSNTGFNESQMQPSGKENRFGPNLSSNCLEIEPNSHSDSDLFVEAGEVLHHSRHHSEILEIEGAEDNFANKEVTMDDQCSVKSLIANENQIQPIGSVKSEENKVFITNYAQYEGIFDDNFSNESPDSNYEHGSKEKSVIMHLISQISIGMDLTKVQLPTYIIEKKSFLESFAELASPLDILIKANNCLDAAERIKLVTKYMLSGLVYERRSMKPKKPLNPILGEIFKCYFECPLDGENPNNCDMARFDFISEQVSHHPPISAMHVECARLGITVDATIYTKSKFLGLSIGCDFLGKILIKFARHDNEIYDSAYPSLYARSILTRPWLEFNGALTVNCEQTQYSFKLNFKGKPLVGGKCHVIHGTCYFQSNPMIKVCGEWTDVLRFTPTHTSHKTSNISRSESYLNNNGIFFSKSNLCVSKYKVAPLNEQAPNESRQLWKDVIFHLVHNDMQKATEAKAKNETKQREDAAYRLTHGLGLPNIYFKQHAPLLWNYTGQTNNF